MSAMSPPANPQQKSGKSASRFQGRRLVPVLICMIWLALITVGYLMLLVYEHMPGPVSNISSNWPRKVAINRLQGDYTLVMAVHPKCPCTNSSLNELAALMTRTTKMKAYVLMFCPSDFAKDWGATSYWQRAAAIPRVTVLKDEDGKAAKEFGVTTSGEIVLYNPQGRAVFTGGITVARGHEGDNQGVDTVEAIVSGYKSIGLRTTPVFGCSLLDELPMRNGKIAR